MRNVTSSSCMAFLKARPHRAEAAKVVGTARGTARRRAAHEHAHHLLRAVVEQRRAQRPRARRGARAPDHLRQCAWCVSAGFEVQTAVHIASLGASWRPCSTPPPAAGIACGRMRRVRGLESSVLWLFNYTMCHALLGTRAHATCVRVLEPTLCAMCSSALKRMRPA